LARLRTDMETTPATEIDRIAAVLENFANRGVFRGFSRGTAHGGRPAFKLLWHRDRMFELVVDLDRGVVRMPVVLPSVPAGSSMHREFRQFVESRQSASLPEHRRIDADKTSVVCANARGNVGLRMSVHDRDYEYAVRKLVNLVHEVYLDFLYDGRYYDYLVETFNLDPDKL
jgi:hypothetical protein